MGLVPAYKIFSIEGKEVLSSKAKFERCDTSVQLNAVLEESYVLALERSQIPYEGKITPANSFLIALEKVCTSITSGWFREFAYDNYFKVAMMYNESYVQKFKDGLNNGIVKPFTKHY